MPFCRYRNEFKRRQFGRRNNIIRSSNNANGKRHGFNWNFRNEKEDESTSTASKTTKKTEERQTKPSSKQEKQTQGYINTTKAKEEAVPSGKGSSTKTTSAKTEKETQAQLSVELSVNCEKAVAYGADYPKYLMSKTKCSVKKGTTVFDLLSEACSKKGLAVVHQNKSYIVSIGGLAEKDCGGSSGWMYTVNGVKPMMSASKYVLKDGDTVEWYYVTSPTDLEPMKNE